MEGEEIQIEGMKKKSGGKSYKTSNGKEYWHEECNDYSNEKKRNTCKTEESEEKNSNNMDVRNYCRGGSQG